MSMYYVHCIGQTKKWGPMDDIRRVYAMLFAFLPSSPLTKFSPLLRLSSLFCAEANLSWFIDVGLVQVSQCIQARMHDRSEIMVNDDDQWTWAPQGLMKLKALPIMMISD